ncbi:pentapeptide repeat-containing protein [Nocardia sp. NPDC003482]
MTPPDRTPDPTARPTRRARLVRGILGAVTWSGWTGVAALATAIAAIGALWFTAQSLRATDNQYGLAQQVAVSDRFQKAVEQLASDRIDQRVAGIYLLERLAKDSPGDRDTIVEVLAAFLRAHAPAADCRIPPPSEPARLAIDHQAALTVLARREHPDARPGSRIDLSRTCLVGATVESGNLGWIQFSDAVLARSTFSEVTFELAVFQRADLTGTVFNDSRLSAVTMWDANLTKVQMHACKLGDGGYAGADLAGADLFSSDNLGTHALDPNEYVENQLPYYDKDTRWPLGFTPPVPSRPAP